MGGKVKVVMLRVGVDEYDVGKYVEKDFGSVEITPAEYKALHAWVIEKNLRGDSLVLYEVLPEQAVLNTVQDALRFAKESAEKRAREAEERERRKKERQAKKAIKDIEQKRALLSELQKELGEINGT